MRAIYSTLCFGGEVAWSVRLFQWGRRGLLRSQAYDNSPPSLQKSDDRRAYHDVRRVRSGRRVRGIRGNERRTNRGHETYERNAGGSRREFERERRALRGPKDFPKRGVLRDDAWRTREEEEAETLESIGNRSCTRDSSRKAGQRANIFENRRDMVWAPRGRPQEDTDWDGPQRVHLRGSSPREPPKTPIQLALASDDDLLYGIRPVLNALQSCRRTFLELYIQDSMAGECVGVARKAGNAAAIASVISYAHLHKIPITYSPKGDLNMLAANHPHQGLVLRASPLEFVPITSLPSFTAHPGYMETGGRKDETTVEQTESAGSYRVPMERGLEKSEEMDSENAPETMMMSNDDATRERREKDMREAIQQGKVRGGLHVPCWLALDEVTDPQNFGALLRSAYFLGCSGVVTCAKNSSGLTPVVSKASAGVMETMPVYSAGSMPRFLRRCVLEGWRVLATAFEEDAISARNLDLGVKTVVVLGSEGRGLRKMVRNECTAVACIGGDSRRGVDSLNVSVAGAIILYQLLGR